MQDSFDSYCPKCGAYTEHDFGGCVVHTGQSLQEFRVSTQKALYNVDEAKNGLDGDRDEEQDSEERALVGP
jgi:ribosomal protein L44E